MIDRSQRHYSPWPLDDEATSRRLACDPNTRVIDAAHTNFFTAVRDKVTGMIHAPVTQEELDSVTCPACHEALSAQVTRDHVRRNPINR